MCRLSSELFSLFLAAGGGRRRGRVSLLLLQCWTCDAAPPSSSSSSLPAPFSRRQLKHCSRRLSQSLFIFSPLLWPEEKTLPPSCLSHSRWCFSPRSQAPFVLLCFLLYSSLCFSVFSYLDLSFTPPLFSRLFYFITNIFTPSLIEKLCLGPDLINLRGQIRTRIYETLITVNVTCRAQ